MANFEKPVSKFTLREYVDHAASSLDMTKSQVAEHLNLSPSMLSLFLSGRRNPSPETRKQIRVLSGGAVHFEDMDTPLPLTPKKKKR